MLPETVIDQQITAQPLVALVGDLDRHHVVPFPAEGGCGEHCVDPPVRPFRLSETGPAEVDWFFWTGPIVSL